MPTTLTNYLWKRLKFEWTRAHLPAHVPIQSRTRLFSGAKIYAMDKKLISLWAIQFSNGLQRDIYLYGEFIRIIGTLFGLRFLWLHVRRRGTFFPSSSIFCCMFVMVLIKIVISIIFHRLILDGRICWCDWKRSYMQAKVGKGLSFLFSFT